MSDIRARSSRVLRDDELSLLLALSISLSVSDIRQSVASEATITFRYAQSLKTQAQEHLKKTLDQARKYREELEENIRDLERENRELKCANEILRKASAFFAQAELDRPLKKW